MGKGITKRNLRILLLSLLLSVMLCGAVSGQAILTPTPDPDGNIFYIIKANDSCMSISLTMGIDLQTLRQLNNLDEECTLIAGTRLLLGRYETPTPTPGPTIIEDEPTLAPTQTEVPAFPEGTVYLPDGTFLLPNGIILYPDGTAIYPGGVIVYPDGTVVDPNAPAATPAPAPAEDPNAGAAPAEQTE